MTKKTKVIILCGGRSAEHEISLLSARNVLAALDRARFDPVVIGIDRAGRWHRESERTLAAATGDPRALALDAAAPMVGIEEGLSAAGPGQPLAALSAGGVDDVVVFPVLHGTFGEDGTVQGLFELANTAYVGAGVLGSAIGMDKDVTKRLLRDAGIPIVDFEIVTAAGFARDPAGALAPAAALGYPMFVKPANAGSSVERCCSSAVCRRARSSARCWATTSPRLRSPPRSSSTTPTASTRTTPSTSTPPAPASRSPPTCPPRSPRAFSSWRSRRSRRSSSPGWRGSTSFSPATRARFT